MRLHFILQSYLSWSGPLIRRASERGAHFESCPVLCGRRRARRAARRTSTVVTPMRATASPVEGNRVRLSVEMDEDEVDQAVRQTARRLAGELRVPGFRPGKVPRQVLEARLGGSSVLQGAGDPRRPARHVRASRRRHRSRPHRRARHRHRRRRRQRRRGLRRGGRGPTDRRDSGIRRTGRDHCPQIEVTDEDVDAQVDRLREQFGELVRGRPAGTRR